MTLLPNVSYMSLFPLVRLLYGNNVTIHTDMRMNEHDDFVLFSSAVQ